MWPSRIARDASPIGSMQVVALDEHGVEAGDAAAVGRAGAFEQRGQQREHRRRVPARRGRLAGRQPDLALRHREAGEAVHQQQHVEVLVAEPLGDAGRGERGAQAHERGLRRRWRRRRPTAASPSGPRSFSMNSRTSRPRSPIEREHGDRRLGAARDHREQRRLADAGAGEDAHALAAAARHRACRARARRAGAACRSCGG